MKRIAIIPARSGSKGLKDKNIMDLNGKPLIAYTIEAAIVSGLFTTIHVSTDSQKYEEIAKAYGANVPFLRSEEMSSDSASSWDVVIEVIKRYSQLGFEYDECVLLQPTSPLRDDKDILRAYRLFKEKKAQSVVSVCEVEHPVEWCFVLDNTLSMDVFDNNPYKERQRQQLPKSYRENGAIYIFKISKLKEKNFDFYAPNCFAYVMNRNRSIDIDNEFDFKLAEFLMK